MTSLLSSLNFFATGTGILFTCAIAAAMILLWDWRFSLIGLFVVQVGVAAVALQTGSVELYQVIVQVCIIALCTLILALSSAQAPRSRSIRQSGNWLMRLLTLVLLYTALRLFDFDFILPLPGIAASEALRITIFFMWISICALLTLSFSNNPLFTGVALLLWSVPTHMLATFLTPESGISVLIGIIELLLALGCSYLILTESFNTEQRPVVASDITFPIEGRRMLTDNSMVPIGEMTTMDIPAVPMTPQARQAMMGATLPQTAAHGTHHTEAPRPVERTRQNQPQPSQPQPSQPRPVQPSRDQQRIDQSRATQRRAQSSTPLTRTNLRAVQNRATNTNLRAVQPPQVKPSSIKPPVQNQVAGDDLEATQPTPNLYSSSLPQSTAPQSTAPQPTAPQPTTDVSTSHSTQQPKADQEEPLISRLLKRIRKDNSN